MAAGDKGCCAICAEDSPEFIPLPGSGPICLDCLLAGRFLGSTGAPRFAQAMRRLADWSAVVRDQIESLVSEAQRLCDKQMFDAGRDALLERAAIIFAAGRPLLSAHLLQHALAIPGSSSAVYAALGDTARVMGCEAEASQHYKTAGWLAMHEGKRALIERVVAGLEQVAPDDAWVTKAQAWLAGDDQAPESLCGFCGKPASEVGDLIQGAQAAICPRCIARLADQASGVERD